MRRAPYAVRPAVAVLLLVMLGSTGAWLLYPSQPEATADNRPRRASVESSVPSAESLDSPDPEFPALAADLGSELADEQDEGDFDEAFPPSDPAWAWAQVDLDALRAEMPDNLYWTMAMPTKDPEVLRERKEARERENREYGKVLSNTATEQEVRAYFGDRQRQSEDYVTFIGRLLDDYHDVIPDRDVRLLKLAQTLHETRLDEYPRQLSDALERREAHAAKREAWLATKGS